MPSSTTPFVRFRSPTASSLIAWVLLLVAVAMMAGWVLRWPVVVRATPGAVMVFSTALCFSLMALPLAMERFLSQGTQRQLQTLVGGVVALIAGLVLIEHLLGLEFVVDWPYLHRWLGDDNPHPGRMSPPTAFAFLLSGTVLVLMSRVRALWTGLLVQALTLAVVVVGLIGIAGWVLRLHLVYRNYLFGQMALATAIGFVLAGAALWLRWRRLDWYRARALLVDEGWRISLNAAAVLALMISVSLLASFGIMQHQIDNIARKSLLEPLRSRVALFATVIDLRATRAALIAANPTHVALLRALNARPGDAAALAQLRAAAESFLPFGFSAVAFQAPEGKPWFETGRFVAKPENELALGAGPIALLWDDGFVMRARVPMTYQGASVGVLIAEQRLHPLTQALEYSYDFAASGNIGVCGRREGRIRCFPHRMQAGAPDLAYAGSVPMARALAGETGVAVAKDLRGTHLISAYKPIGTLGLGMVISMETAELYAPLRQQMYLLLLLVAFMVGAGVLLLHWRIAPLARSLFLNEQRLTLALDSSRSAVWDVDLRNRRVYLSEQWPTLLGGDPEATSTTLEDLFTLVHPDDIAPLQRKVTAALKSDAGQYDVEHRVRTLSGQWAWIHSVGRVVERNGQGRALRLTGVNTDITRRKEAEAFVERRASYDEATGLPNRSGFNDRLQTAMARSRRAPPDRSLMALLYVSINECRRVSEEFGQAAGPILLKDAALRFKEHVRATDTIARMGIDEFAIILEELGLTEQASGIARKLIAALRPEFSLGRRTIKVTASIGIAFYDGVVDVTAEQLVGKAHQAMYDAHNEGPNTYLTAAS